MSLNPLDVLLVVALLGLEIWRRWLRHTPEAPRWFRYVTIPAAVGIAVRLFAWRYAEWGLDHTPTETVRDAQAFLERMTPFVIAGNVVAVVGLAGAAITLLAGTWRYRWSARERVPPTVGPYR